MSTDPPPVDPKVKMLAELCKEEDAILELTFPVMDNSFQIEMVVYVCYNNSNTMLANQIQNVAH